MCGRISVFDGWDEGYVFDKYVVSSKYISDTPFGNPIFDTEYTEVGKLLHAMKYNGRIDTSERIVALCADFLKQWLYDKHVDVIIPAPPTVSRDVQPLYVIAEAMSKTLRIPLAIDVLEKTVSEQAKNMPKDKKFLSGTIRKLKHAKRKCNILLIDDLYSTGETASECVSVLKEDEMIDKIYFFALAKTK